MTDDIRRQVDDAIREQLTGATVTTPPKTLSDLATVTVALLSLVVCAAIAGLLWRVFAFTAGLGA